MPVASHETLVAANEPSVVISTGFNKVSDNGELVISTHTDTIQAMLLTAKRFPQLEVMLKGRAGGEESRRIQADPLYQAFTKNRAERSESLERLLTDGSVSETPTRLTVEQSASGEPFGCKFFSMSALVDDWLEGRTTANYLMINFGGATDFELGSNSASPDQLQAYAAALVFEVHARQLGEVPDAIFRNRLNSLIA